MALPCDHSSSRVAIFEVGETCFNYDYCNQVHGANVIKFLINNE